MIENTEPSNNEASGILASVIRENQERNEAHAMLLDALNGVKHTDKRNLAEALDRALDRIRKDWPFF